MRVGDHAPGMQARKPLGRGWNLCGFGLGDEEKKCVVVVPRKRG